MQSGTNPHLDANATHSPEIREDDPRHLGNLMKRMSAMNSQVSADTKYDPQAPPRVDLTGKRVQETFISELEASDDAIFSQILYLISGVCLIIIVIAIVFLLDPRLRKIIMNYSYGTTTLLLTILISLITIGFVKYTIQTNEDSKWEPQYTS